MPERVWNMRHQLAALVAFLPSIASAGWITLEHQPPFPAGSPSSPTSFVFLSGCVKAGQYERAAVSSTTARATLNGLPDAGRCWFASTAGSAARSNEVAFDFSTQEAVPGTPAAAPVITWDVATTPPPSSIWASADIGGAMPAGSFVESPVGTFTLRSAGVDIWGTSDQFRFAYQPLNGDGEITARIASLTTTNVWSKAGVMIRETLAANSRYAFTLLTPTAAAGADFQYRLAPGGAAAGQPDQVSVLPRWVRIKRVGNVFSSYLSADGVTWVQFRSSVTIPMGAATLVGLPLTSHQPDTLATATLTDVVIR